MEPNLALCDGLKVWDIGRGGRLAREGIYMCVRTKSVQSCLTLCDTMGCRPRGFSVHGILQARIGVDCHFPLQGIFPTQGLNPHFFYLLHWQADSLPLVPSGKPCKAERRLFYLLILILQIVHILTGFRSLIKFHLPREAFLGSPVKNIKYSLT